MAKSKPRTSWKTSGQDFRIFQEAAAFFIEKFGVSHWGVEYAHADNSDTEGARACCRSSTRVGQTAVLTLAVTWDQEPDTARLTRSAFHEVLHLVLNDMYNVALYDELLPEQRDRAYIREEHKLIRRFENLILPMFAKDLYEKLGPRTLTED